MLDFDGLSVSGKFVMPIFDGTELEGIGAWTGKLQLREWGHSE